MLDARAIPRQVRPGTILGALAQLPTGDGLVLVAPHDPRPLLAQIEATNPDRFVVQYLEEGPDAWQLAFTRRRPGDGLT